MKKVYLILSIVLLIGLAVVMFIGCGGGDGDGTITTAADPTDACMVCHSDNTDTGEQLRGAQAQYLASGHWKGPRTLYPYDIADSVGHMYVFHGSNAAYANATAYGSACQLCHTHEGFVEYVETGANTTTTDQTPAPPGCFTCHSPHEDGSFSLRTTSAVTMADDTVFDGGKGNLCVVCHLARTDVADGVDPDDFKDHDGSVGTLDPSVALSSHWGPHHGPQGDFLMGANNWDSATIAATGTSPHMIGNSCVTCHHYQPTSGRLSGNLEFGGHAFYLTSEVHGSSKDLTVSCSTCHSTADFDEPAGGNDESGFLWMDVYYEDWDGDTNIETILQEIQGLRDTLITYFGTGSNFMTITDNGVGAVPRYTYNAPGATTGNGGIVDAVAYPADDPIDTTPADGTWDNGYDWVKSWDFAGAEMTEAQAQAYWNLKYFIEDKSMGIHNPHFAAEMLYEAVVSLGLTFGDDPSVPCIKSLSVAADNTYADITFTEGVYTNGGVSQLVLTDLTVTIATNAGAAAQGTAPSSVTQADSTTEVTATALAGGETVVRVWLTGLTNPGTATGVETITITPATGASISDSIDKDMPTTQTTGAVTLTDMVESTITSVVEDVSGTGTTDRYVDITFSEGVFASSNGTGALATSDFKLTFTAGTGATAVSISSLSLTTNSPTEAEGIPLGGGETVIRLWLEITGTPNGSGTFVIEPAKNTAIFDSGGNGVEISENSGTKTLTT